MRFKTDKTFTVQMKKDELDTLFEYLQTHQDEIPEKLKTLYAFLSNEGNIIYEPLVDLD